jgi:hypothetical protein
LTSGKRQEHQRDGDGDRPRRVDVRARHALDVHPHDDGDDQRHTNVDEGEQREQAAVDGFDVEEVADQRPVEHRQDVEPLGGGDDDELRQLVPDEHEAVDAGDVDQPQQRHPGQPRERAEAAIAVVGEVPQHVQQHGQDHAVGGVAVDAAQDAAGPPLVVRDPLDRVVGVMDAGIGKDVEVETGSDEQPELPEADRSQMVEGVELVAEGHVEDVLDAHEEPAQDLLQEFDHGRCQLMKWVGREWRPRAGEARSSIRIVQGGWRSFEEQAATVRIEVDHHHLRRGEGDLLILDVIEARLSRLSSILTVSRWLPAATSKRLYTVETPSL